MTCHGEVGDPSANHSIKAMGCRVCHLGDSAAHDADGAHAGMVAFPGDLDVAEKTCGACHGTIVARVKASAMNTGRGMVAVNRFAFGEQATPDGDDTIGDLADSPADQHFRQLCIACHLGASRARHEGIDGSHRGGGCAACHLQADSPPDPGRGHSRLVLHPDDDACFGCHSGSSRIALSYQGWYETDRSAREVSERKDIRILGDGRVLAPMPADVHFAAGLACIDCHTPREIMGNGSDDPDHQHGEQAIEIACHDCHRTAPPETVSGAALDPESLTLLRLDPGLPRPDRAFVATARGLALVNVVVDEDDGGIEVWEKHTGRVHRAGPPSEQCASPGHERLDCQTCHAAWAPQCLGCHTRRESDGVFREYQGGFVAGPPTLAVRGERIVPAVPGMIMQLDDGRGERLVRLFAPITPHTIHRPGRSCASCHRDPLALGYGRGDLHRVVPVGHDGAPGNGAARERVRFDPRYLALADGLPADAWIPVLARSAEAVGGRATRSDMRPLDLAEQRRVLRVGECLGCHDGGDGRIYHDFAAAVAGMKPGPHHPGSQ